MKYLQENELQNTNGGLSVILYAYAYAYYKSGQAKRDAIEALRDMVTQD